MQWIIFIGDEGLTLNRIKAIEHYDSIGSHDVNEERYCVDFGPADHIFYDVVPDLRKDYGHDELAKIPIFNPNFIMMVYRSENRMRAVLKQENFVKGIGNVYVDNDYGLIVPIKEYIELGMPAETKYFQEKAKHNKA